MTLSFRSPSEAGQCHRWGDSLVVEFDAEAAAEAIFKGGLTLLVWRNLMPADLMLVGESQDSLAGGFCPDLQLKYLPLAP